MNIPKRPTPFAKLIDLGPDGQVLVFIRAGSKGEDATTQGPALVYMSNGTLEVDPITVFDPQPPGTDILRKIAEYDEDDAKRFVAWARERQARKATKEISQ
jgi:hypothetical protein